MRCRLSQIGSLHVIDNNWELNKWQNNDNNDHIMHFLFLLCYQQRQSNVERWWSSGASLFYMSDWQYHHHHHLITTAVHVSSHCSSSFDGHTLCTWVYTIDIHNHDTDSSYGPSDWLTRQVSTPHYFHDPKTASTKKRPTCDPVHNACFDGGYHMDSFLVARTPILSNKQQPQLNRKKKNLQWVKHSQYTPHIWNTPIDNKPTLLYSPLSDVFIHHYTLWWVNGSEKIAWHLRSQIQSFRTLYPILWRPG